MSYLTNSSHVIFETSTVTWAGAIELAARKTTAEPMKSVLFTSDSLWCCRRCSVSKAVIESCNMGLSWFKRHRLLTSVHGEVESKDSFLVGGLLEHFGMAQSTDRVVIAGAP